MLIAFEGIDGSGKTTLSNALAKRLKKRGFRTFHARENGELGSAISAQIRLLTQNPQNLAITANTEFLLYAAREAQLLHEVVKPRLDAGDCVICDRSLYTSLVLATAGRRLLRQEVEPILHWAAGGLWPDIVFFCDVPIETSRVRKKIQKILDKKQGGGSRKGAFGLGLRRRLREGYLALCQENDAKWVYLDTNRLNPEEALEAAWAYLAPRLGVQEAPAPPRIPPAPSLKAGPEETLRARYFASAEEISQRDTRLAAYLLNGFDTEEAFTLREKLISKEPALIAYSLAGLRSEAAMQLRLRLSEQEPYYTAYSLRGVLPPFANKEAPTQPYPAANPNWRQLFVFGEGEEARVNVALSLWDSLSRRTPKGAALSLQGLKTAVIPALWELRRMLSLVDPEAALSTFRGIDHEDAWRVREEAKTQAPTLVLRSLAYLDTERAWEMRERLFSLALPRERLESLVGLDTERAWEMRERLFAEAPLDTLASVRGLSSDASFLIRERLFAKAPKIVIQGLNGSTDERAWRYREEAAQDVMEVLESMRGLPEERATRLREQLRDIWPFATISSLGRLAKTEAGITFIKEQLTRHPTNLHVAKHALRAFLVDTEEEAEDV